MSKASILTYPQNSQEKTAILDYSYKPKKLIPIYTNTGNNSTLILQIEAEEGTEIGVYDTRDVLIGAGVVRNNLASVTIWGDDPNTDIHTGAIPGENLTVKLLNSVSGLLHELKINGLHSVLTKQFTDVVTYHNDAVYFGKSSFNQMSDYLRLSPNPANNFIKLEFDVIQPGISIMKLYSMIGDELYSITNGHRDIGTYELTFNVVSYPNGIYSIMYEHNANKIFKTFVIVR
jgi:hypothetical protein